MPTGLPPMVTSFTSLSSNIRLSFAISFSSCGAVAARMFARPPAQPRKPATVVVLDADDDDCNVVRAAFFVCQRDELIRCVVQICFGLQGGGDVRLSDHPGEAIGAK